MSKVPLTDGMKKAHKAKTLKTYLKVHGVYQKQKAAGKTKLVYSSWYSKLLKRLVKKVDGKITSTGKTNTRGKSIRKCVKKITTKDGKKQCRVRKNCKVDGKTKGQQVDMKFCKKRRSRSRSSSTGRKKKTSTKRRSSKTGKRSRSRSKSASRKRGPLARIVHFLVKTAELHKTAKAARSAARKWLGIRRRTVNTVA